jgi:hypothetical protein
MLEKEAALTIGNYGHVAIKSDISTPRRSELALEFKTEIVRAFFCKS